MSSLTKSIFLGAWVAAIAANAGGLPIRIESVGDSITAGYTDNPTWSVEFDFSYRLGLYRRLTQANYSFQFVGESPEPWNGLSGLPKIIGSPDLRPLGQDHHRGYGWMTSQVANGQVNDWMNADNPDVMLLMLGTVDLMTLDTVTVENNLKALLNTIVAARPELYVIVAQMTPVTDYDYRIPDYNEYIRTVLVPSYASLGKHVFVVDQYANFLLPGGSLEAIDTSLFSNGHHHPSPVGYDRMAQTWFEAIQTLFPTGSKPIINQPSVQPDGHVQVWFQGTPNTVYSIDRAVSVGGPWELGFTNLTANAQGLFELDDSNAGTPATRFYRLAVPPP